jgi:hypothetical protein
LQQIDLPAEIDFGKVMLVNIHNAGPGNIVFQRSRHGE